jgi:drug/metabolite transporter (DMT)-like permease
MNSLLVVIVAVSAALVLGAASVAELRGAKRVRHRGVLSPRIILDLVRQPVWAVGVGGSAAGFALQILALRYGSIAVVEPILACALVFAVLIGSWLRRRLDAVAIAGVAACAGGVAGFLIIARPSNGGMPDRGLQVPLLLTVGLAVLLAGCLAAARHLGRFQSLALAAACGACYGASAFLVKLVLSGGPPHLLGSWPLYALAVIGPLGFLLNQQAFARAVSMPPVLAIITTADPVISVVLAASWLGERLSSDTAQIAGQAAALALMAAGIAVLAHHLPRTASPGEAPRERESEPSPPDNRDRQEGKQLV